MSCSHAVVLGLDFGGTKLAAGVVDLRHTQIVDAARVDTPSAAGASASVDAIIRLARALKSVTDITGIGVSFGGHVRNLNVSHSFHVSGWTGYPLGEQLRAEFGVKDVRLANDANAVALGEWHFGAGRGAHSLLYITVSTGIGGGVIADGRLIEGYHGIAGEIGHTRVESGGPRCTCGGQGCLEAFAAGPAIVRTALAALEAQPDVYSHMREYQPLTAKIVATQAEAGDLLAAGVIRGAARYLGGAIGTAVNLLDVERVVIGGGVSRAGPIWWDAVRESAHEVTMHWFHPLDIRRSELGEDEGIWGAVAQLVEG